MHKYKRSERVGDLVAQEVASLLLSGDIKDPKIGFVTITHVKMSPDMKHARIFFSVMGDEKVIKKSSRALNRACGYIRRAVAKKLQLKYIPEIIFEFDDSLEYSSRIDELLKEIKEQDGGE